MKKILFICACFFLIGCQSNEEPVVDSDPEIEEENQEEDIDQGEEEVVEGDENPDSEEPTDSDPVDEPNEDIEPEVEDPEEEEEQNETEEPGETDEADESYSPDEAVTLVKEHIQGMDADIGLNYNYDGEDDQGNYRIQVFEVVVHGEDESHTATYGWYLVNPETGEITDMFE